MEYLYSGIVGFLLGSGLILLRHYRSQVSSDLAILNADLVALHLKVDKAVSSFSSLLEKK